MICRSSLFVAALGLAVSAPAMAQNMADGTRQTYGSVGSELPAYLQCVPFAREKSGIQIYGDAHTWWDQAEGRFERGDKPKQGAVMAFAPTGSMALGHVAVVSKVIDSRTILLDHANWSPINGRRGQVELGVRAVDVSKRNDWSEVKVWYAPSQDVGTNAWPVHGFIYAGKQSKKNLLIAAERASKRSAQPVQMAAYTAPKAVSSYAKAPVYQPAVYQPAAAYAPAPKAASREFSQAFADLAPSPKIAAAAVSAPKQIAAASVKPATKAVAKAGRKKPSLAQPYVAPQAKSPVQVAYASTAPARVAKPSNAKKSDGPSWPQTMAGPGGKAKAPVAVGSSNVARAKPVNLLAALGKRP